MTAARARRMGRIRRAGRTTSPSFLPCLRGAAGASGAADGIPSAARVRRRQDAFPPGEGDVITRCARAEFVPRPIPPLDENNLPAASGTEEETQCERSA
jgi:hypothetical protein